MSTLVITRGIPASGKSTWARKWVAEAEPGQRVRVNRDDLRFQLFNSYWGDTVDEQAVTLAQNALVEGFLNTGVSVVLDNTNLRARDVKQTLKLASKYRTLVLFEDFPIAIEEAVARDAVREEMGARYVGADVIRNFGRFLTNGYKLPPVPVLEGNDVYEHKPYVPGKISAVSFDIDGTLAHMDGRSPYDPTLYHTDTVDLNVRQVLHDAHNSGYEVILLSGRNAAHRAETMAWLRSNDIPFDKLIMRPASDPQTNDAIVKSYLVDEHISGVYDIVMHYDDRDRVVEALRAKGIKVAQVNPGAF